MTGICDVWIPKRLHDQVMTHLFPGDRDEHGGVLRCGIVRADGNLRLLVRDVVPADDGRDYLPGERGYRALQPRFIMDNIKACGRESLAYLAIHNHDCDTNVGFSATDITSHERGYGALLDIGRGVPVGALVYGRRSVEADIWLPGGERLNLGEYRVIGQAIERYYASPRRASARGYGTLDRQIRIFGEAGQDRLANASVAIVGLGGVGSLVCEYLARLGVGRLVLIDPDVIEATNLARVIGATKADVGARRRKVDIAARVAREAHPTIELSLIDADVARCDIADRLRMCDFIFLAADSMRARLVVNAIAHQYLIPVTQLGAKIRPGEGGAIVDAMSAIRQIRPGEGCLWCNELIDPGQLAIEVKSDEERKAQAYGTEEVNPSVITLNAVASAHGVNDFLFDFLGLREGSPTQFCHHLFLSHRLQKVATVPLEGCPECTLRLARGDAQPLPCLPMPADHEDGALTAAPRGFWHRLARMIGLGRLAGVEAS